MGSALGRWHRSHHEVRSAAGQCRTSILWQRCSSAQRIALEHAAANRIPVPQKAELTVRNSEHGQTVQSATTTAGEGLPPSRFSGQKQRPSANKLLSALRRFAGK